MGTTIDHQLIELIHEFSTEMKRELFIKAKEGKTDWNDYECLRHYKERLQDRVALFLKGDMSQAPHIANQTMIIKRLEERGF